MGVEDKKEGSKIRHTSIMGYVFRVQVQEGKWMLPKYIGRDLTARFLDWLHGISVDLNDTMGKPPYPDVS